ncbi:hypothetical protein B2G71_15415 [Novosphingobium sp. PC22D]|uniref:helix-turn-helix domain-containing protein n=1 Tax=Novosphingobium sp. PC22D TaxID=1962403 RepID=UPI000BF22FF3|nr:helix-turn-helix transcriptional regulator [Novosphingobium sp. PC22D]PEQ11827.1 hypothetical protein B2G71_15415 [Novosphingobium sp. PC22D]
MALTGPDETDLLLPLLGGAAENPRFSTFLSRFKRRCDAVYAAIHLRSGSGRDPVRYWVGLDLHSRAHEQGAAELIELDRIQYDRLRPGRVYGSAEYFDADPVRQAQRRRYMARLGIADERTVRLLDERGADAWLSIASGRPCTAAQGALLSTLAPYVATVLRGLLAQERDRAIAEVSQAGLQRSGIGWIAFRANGEVLTLPEQTEAALAGLLGTTIAAGDRIRQFGPAVERKLIAAAAHFAADPDAAAEPIVLQETPRLEAQLCPGARPPSPGDADAVERPAMIALLRMPRRDAGDRAGAFARLFDLPRREAELAVALSDGLSLTEAGAALGLTIETTRNYSKKLYGKLDVRGQAELVRLVCESAAQFA